MSLSEAAGACLLAGEAWLQAATCTANASWAVARFCMGYGLSLALLGPRLGYRLAQVGVQGLGLSLRARQSRGRA